MIRKPSIRKPAGGVSSWTRSVRIPKPRLSTVISVRMLVIKLTVIVLCLGTLNISETLFNFPIHYLILVLDIFAMLCIHNAGDLDYGLDLLPFVACTTITLAFQTVLAGPYFSWSSSFSSIILLYAMLICVILVMQKGYGDTIWKIINFFNLLSAICILVQYGAYMVGIRLDKMGSLSEWFFNAWEFSDSFRPCGTHDEPSAFAKTVLPSLYYYLFVGKNWKKALICIGGLAVSTSALGLLGMLLLLVVWLCNLDKLYGFGIRTKYLILGIIGLVGSAACLVVLNMDIFIVERMMSGSSVGVRVLRSVDLFSLMSPVEKIIGIGVQNQQNYLNHYGIILAHDTYETTIGANREFAGTLGYILCTTGFFGLVFFVMPFYRTYKRHGLQVKVACALMLFCSLFCIFFNHTILVVFLLMVYATVDMERNGAFRQEDEDET